MTHSSLHLCHAPSPEEAYTAMLSVLYALLPLLCGKYKGARPEKDKVRGCDDLTAFHQGLCEHVRDVCEFNSEEHKSATHEYLHFMEKHAQVHDYIVVLRRCEMRLNPICTGACDRYDIKSVVRFASEHHARVRAHDLGMPVRALIWPSNWRWRDAQGGSNDQDDCSACWGERHCMTQPVYDAIEKLMRDLRVTSPGDVCNLAEALEAFVPIEDLSRDGMVVGAKRRKFRRFCAETFDFHSDNHAVKFLRCIKHIESLLPGLPTEGAY